MDSVAALPPEDPELYIPNISESSDGGAVQLPAIAIAPPLVAHASRAYMDRIPAGPIFQSYTTLCTQVQLHTTFHYPPTPPVEGESPDKLQPQLPPGDGSITQGPIHPDGSKGPPPPPPQHFQSLPTPPTPELGAPLQPQPQPVENPACSPVPATSPAGAAYPSIDPCKQLYQWQTAGSNFCVMGPPPFNQPGFPRRPPPLYYQAEKNCGRDGPPRHLSDFVMMKESLDGE